jgi:hypothetical protein
MVSGHKYFSTKRHDQGYLLFSVELCDKCGNECEAANAYFALEPATKLIKFGMEQRDQCDGTLHYCDELDMCVCMHCWQPSET